MNVELCSVSELYSDGKCHISDMFVSLHRWSRFPREISSWFVIRIPTNDCSSPDEHCRHRPIRCPVPVREFWSLGCLDAASIVVGAFRDAFGHFRVSLWTKIRWTNVSISFGRFTSFLRFLTFDERQQFFIGFDRLQQTKVWKRMENASNWLEVWNNEFVDSVAYRRRSAAIFRVSNE